MTTSPSARPTLRRAVLMAGVPAVNHTLYHQTRFRVGDPAALIAIDNDQGGFETMLLVRDIEVERARRTARADRVASPADFTPDAGLSGDRETATAQATAECLRRQQIGRVTADRTLPLIYVDALRQAGIAVEYDPALGVRERRAKDEQEIGWLGQAQATTEGAVRLACEMVANARAQADGVLLVDGTPLTSERVRMAIDLWLMQQGFETGASIVAGGPVGADCHALGAGPLRTEEPVLIDIFPRCKATGYHGDCTRTVVHGQASPELAAMHAAVVRAKAAGIAAIQAGTTGEAVHIATTNVITAAGYQLGLPQASDKDAYCAMVHGTGHGVGLDVHEPPLLDHGGPELVVGDVLTVEPGLYRRDLGGVRSEDMVVVTVTGCDNLNQLPEGLGWR